MALYVTLMVGIPRVAVPGISCLCVAQVATQNAGRKDGAPCICAQMGCHAHTLPDKPRPDITQRQEAEWDARALTTQPLTNQYDQNPIGDGLDGQVSIGDAWLAFREDSS